MATMKSNRVSNYRGVGTADVANVGESLSNIFEPQELRPWAPDENLNPDWAVPFWVLNTGMLDEWMIRQGRRRSKPWWKGPPELYSPKPGTPSPKPSPKPIIPHIPKPGGKDLIDPNLPGDGEGDIGGDGTGLRPVNIYDDGSSHMGHLKPGNLNQGHWGDYSQQPWDTPGDAFIGIANPRDKEKLKGSGIGGGHGSGDGSLGPSYIGGGSGYGGGYEGSIPPGGYSDSATAFDFMNYAAGDRCAAGDPGCPDFLDQFKEV